MNQAQVYDGYSQPRVPAQGTLNASTETVESSLLYCAQRTGSFSQVQTKFQAAELRTSLQPSRFSCYRHDHYRDIASRQHLTECGLKKFLAQESAIPKTREKKREHLKTISQSTLA